MSYVQAQKFKLAGSGCTSIDTSIVLTSMKLPDGTTNVSMADFGTIGFATIEPGTVKEEQISFTGISIDVDTDAATLTGVIRGLRFVYPYDEVSANKKSHAGGSLLVLSNTAGFYGNIKDYIDNLSIAGSVPATTSVQGIAYLPTIEYTASTTHSLTTVADQKIIVWARGVQSNFAGSKTITLKYNGVTKDSIAYNSTAVGVVSLMYTDTPGAGTHDIVLATDVGNISDGLIIVLKIRQS